MNVIPANDLKTKGVTVLQKALEDETEVGISIRGQERLVVIDKAHYDYLRECEIIAALAETREDLVNGKFFIESIGEHIKRITL